MNQVEVRRRQIEISSFIIGLINIMIFGSKLGHNGITYLIIAMECFVFSEIISSGCVADALGKMLRSRIAKSQFKNSKLLKRRLLILQGSLGVVCCVVLAGFSGALAQKLFKVQHSTFILMIFAPVLILRAVSAVLTGFFQGEGAELLAGVSALLRQFLVMGLGLLFVNILGDYGIKVSNLLGDDSYVAMYGGAGIAIAFVLSELLVLLFLIVITMGHKDSGRQHQNEGIRQTDSLINTVKLLYGSMGITILLRIFEMLPLWIGTLFYRKSELNIASFVGNFGVFSGKYVPICAGLALLICAMVVPANARILGAYRKEDLRSAKTVFQCGLHTISLYGVFFVVFVAIMAEQLTGILCGTDNKVLTGLFRYGSVMVLLVSLYYYLSLFLKRMGREYYLLGCLGVANILFIIIVSVLLNKGGTGILSLVYAAVAALVVACAAVGFMCLRLLHTGIQWQQIVAIPLGAGCIAGLLCLLMGKLLTPHLGNFVTLFLCFLISFLVYWVIILLLKGIREQYLKYIPGGSIIRAVGQSLRIFL